MSAFATMRQAATSTTISAASTRARDNGVRYASFGLVWREFGARVCDGDQEVADAVDETLVQSVDANDTGQQLTQSLIDGVRLMTVNGIIGGFNARWDEVLTAEQERERFDAAVALAQGILAREVASAASRPARPSHRARGDRGGFGSPRRSSCRSTPRGSRCSCPRRPTPCS